MTPEIAVFTEDRIRSAIGPAEALQAIRRAFEAEAHGAVTNPAPWHLAIADSRGEVHVKGAHLTGDTYFAVKISTGFYRNPDLGLPSASGMVTVFHAGTGLPSAILLDNGYLTELRTGAAGALATDLLAPARIPTAAILGVGGQARYQLQALLAVRQPQQLLVYGRHPERTRTFAQWARTLADWRVETVPDPHSAASSADLLITVTPAEAPLVEPSWLRPGTHVTAVGSDSPHKRELAPEVMTGADLIAVDDLTQSRQLGELKGITLTCAPVTIGDLPIGAATGRTSPDQITIADLTGLGSQDAALAELATHRLTAGSA